jgi:hypothetical protein
VTFIPKGAIMRIKDLDWKGDTVWPPEWWPPEHADMIGENGVLKKVGIQDIKHRYIQVEIETPKGSFWGVIMLENPGNLEILYQKLNDSIGRPLKQIGDQEINLFPSLQKRGMKQIRLCHTPRNMRPEANKK